MHLSASSPIEGNSQPPEGILPFVRLVLFRGQRLFLESAPPERGISSLKLKRRSAAKERKATQKDNQMEMQESSSRWSKSSASCFFLRPFAFFAANQLSDSGSSRFPSGIVANRDDFGLRWQSEAATPLSNASP